MHGQRLQQQCIIFVGVIRSTLLVEQQQIWYYPFVLRCQEAIAT